LVFSIPSKVSTIFIAGTPAIAVPGVNVMRSKVQDCKPEMNIKISRAEPPDKPAQLRVVQAHSPSHNSKVEVDFKTLRKQLRSGTSKGLLTKHLRKTQHAYGMKILSGVELPVDAALRSRCVHLPMSETERTDLPKPWDERIVKAADAVRGQLLQLRLERYASVSPRTIPGAEKLRPRSRDLLSSLLAPLEGVKDIEQLLLAFFFATHDPSTRNLLSPAQAAAVGALFEFVHFSANPASVQISAVAEIANQILAATGERIKPNARATSDLLTSMGFSARVRSNRGSLLALDKSTVIKIHRLKRIHDVQWPESTALKVQMGKCDFCKTESPVTPTESDK
jgi:hypothetical protein